MGEDVSNIERPAPPQYPIESVDNALKLLLLLGERNSIRLTEASNYLGVASSTAHRLLAMLQYRGFVRQNSQTKAYEPGPSLSSVASAVMRHVDIRARAHPVLQRLAETVGETVHLGRLDGTKVFFVDSIEGQRAVRVGSRFGTSLPAHCTSTGKALLASCDPQAVRLLYPQERLPVLTPHSLNSRKALEAELAIVREKGYATSMEESEDGVASVATLLGDFAGSKYALNISAPVTRMTEAMQKEFAAQVIQAAQDIKSYFV